MAFTFVQSDFEASTGTATTIAQALTSVGSARLLLAWVKHEGPTTTITVKDDLNNTFTAATKTTHTVDSSNLHGQFHYLLSSTSGTRTITATFGATRDFRSLIVWEFSSANGAQFDTEAGTFGTTSSGDTVISSGNFTTTAADTVVIGGYGEYSGSDTNTERCNDLAATAVVRTSSQANFTTGWYRIFSSTFTGDVDLVLPPTAPWIMRGIVFRDGAAAPSFTPELMGPQQKRYPILHY